jgi:hypothetical protein
MLMSIDIITRLHQRLFLCILRFCKTNTIPHNYCRYSDVSIEVDAWNQYEDRIYENQKLSSTLPVKKIEISPKERLTVRHLKSEICNGLMVPIVSVDQIYSFDRDTIMKVQLLDSDQIFLRTIIRRLYRLCGIPVSLKGPFIESEQVKNFCLFSAFMTLFHWVAFIII